MNDIINNREILKEYIPEILNKRNFISYEKHKYFLRNKKFAAICFEIEINKLKFYNNPYKLLHYIIKNNITKWPRCKICNKELKTFNNTGDFVIYCSQHCNRSDPEIKEKVKNTCIKRYGVEHSSQSEIVKNKFENTMTELYGVKYSAQSEKISKKRENTCIIKYGNKHPMQSEIVKNKFENTMTELYGARCSSQSKILKEKAQKTRKENGNRSKAEIYIEEKLKEVFSEVKSEYNDKRYINDCNYLYDCDFYIPKLDLFIEYQGYWSHGKEPFDPENNEHQKILEEWKTKNTKSYKNAIYVWTELDVRKRQIAKENNLNWIEFFNMKEFDKWLLIN